LRRPADSCCPGLTPAQEQRCAAVGKAVMSAPVSAMMMSATVGWASPRIVEDFS
jgi:hypothetical protein